MSTGERKKFTEKFAQNEKNAHFPLSIAGCEWTVFLWDGRGGG